MLMLGADVAKVDVLGPAFEAVSEAEDPCVPDAFHMGWKKLAGIAGIWGLASSRDEAELFVPVEGKGNVSAPENDFVLRRFGTFAEL